MRARGHDGAKVVVVGPPPGPEELRSNLSFDKRTFDLVSGLMKSVGFELDDILFVNCTSTGKVGGGKLTPKQIMDDASQHLLPLLYDLDPKLVIPLGNEALYAVGGHTKPEKINSFRGKLLKSNIVDTSDNGDEEPVFDFDIVPTVHPFFVLKNPEEASDMLLDLCTAYKYYNGDYSEQAPVEVRMLDKPEDIDRMLKSFKGKWVAYDHESDSAVPATATIVASSFADGSQNKNGEYIVWVWCGYDKLVPRFDLQTMSKFWERFDNFYSRAGKDYKLVGHNSIKFDDILTQNNLGKKYPVCQRDTMLDVWCLDNVSKNDLKSNTHRFLGYSDYEKDLKEHIGTIAKRRGNVYKESSPEYEEDKLALSLIGEEFVVNETKTGRKSIRWPSPTKTNVEKLLAAWALVPFEILIKYAAYDAIYTWLIFQVTEEAIKEQGLEKSSELRHRFTYVARDTEQRGILTDVKTNREFARELKKFTKTCKEQIIKITGDVNFNANSPKQLAEYLYGTPVEVPTISLDDYLETRRNEIIKDTSGNLQFNIRFKVMEFEEEFYKKNRTKIREAVLTDAFDYDSLKMKFLKEFTKSFGFADVVKNKEFFCMGDYEPVMFTKSGAPAVSRAALQSLYEQKKTDFLSYVLMERKASKLLSTFVEAIYNKLDHTNSLHSRYNTIGTRTGRISSSGPNHQNYPKKMRGQHIPREGYRFVTGDLSQAEIRVVAAFSGDESLIEALNSEDIHRSVAAQIFHKPEEEITSEERRYTKSVNFGLIYGASNFRLSHMMNCSVQETEQFVKRYFERFPKLKQWLASQVRQAYEPPHEARTAWGTKCSVINVLSVNKKNKAHAERVATNMPIQGTAGELTLHLICSILERWNTSRENHIYLVNTTHDSFTFEVLADEAEDLVELCNSVVADNKDLPPPINLVDFKADIEIEDFWDGKPNLEQALLPDPEKEDYFRWDLLIPEEVLESKEEIEEIEEMYDEN